MIFKRKFGNIINRFYSANRSIRIGCSSGFWGDSSIAAQQLASKGNINFLVSDYLSEITMSLLAAVKTKNQDAGFVPDFIQFGVLPALRDIRKNGIRLVTNAGGLNVAACESALRQSLTTAGWKDVKIATVLGDALPLDLCNSTPGVLTSLNAYLGSVPIKLALDAGADIVITGRCVDSALTLGPLMHHFQWEANDFNQLALGSLAGHLVECGAQSTGGIFTDHQDVNDWWNIGFPIVDFGQSTSASFFYLTKPEGTGGLVSRATVCEQLLYELGDPGRYLLPDVVCNFKDVEIIEDHQENNDVVVKVSGAKGYHPDPANYKVTGTYQDGYRINCGAIVIGPGAVIKARRTAEEIIKRVKTILAQLKLPVLRRVHIHPIGGDESYPPNLRQNSCGVREVCLWLAAESSSRTSLELLAREIASAGTGMAPGLTGLVGSGRPKVSPVFRLFTTHIPMATLPVEIRLNGELVHRYQYSSSSSTPNQTPISTESTSIVPESSPRLPSENRKRRLGELAWLRSGDKSDMCNIGVIARNEEAWSLLRAELTVEKVGAFFAHLMEDETLVERFELPGTRSLNFLLPKSLGGGGTSSLRIDPQGKAYAQMLSDLII